VESSDGLSWWWVAGVVLGERVTRRKRDRKAGSNVGKAGGGGGRDDYGK
jgi:hypothetical protein